MDPFGPIQLPDKPLPPRYYEAVKTTLPLLTGSLIVAVASLGTPMIFANTPSFGRAIWASAALGAIWVFLFLWALLRFKRRGLWLLVGAPFAFCQPCVWGLIYWQCQVVRNLNACP
jgi:hypothetical protein